MAQKLIFDLLHSEIDVDSFKKWIMGGNVEKISGRLERIEFVSYIMNYVLEETNKYVSTVSSNLQLKVKDKTTDHETPQSSCAQEKVAQDDTSPAVPFQTINRITPTKTPNKSFSRHFNKGNDTRRNILNSLSHHEGKPAPSSTPVKTVHRRNIERKSLSPVPSPLSPPGHSSSNSSPIHFSPTSPQYSEAFPDLGGGGKSRPRQPQTPCLADFITTKPASQKSKKRIKPTQLTLDTTADKKESFSNSITLESVSRPFVPMNSPLLTQIENPDKQSFDEERNLLRQKRTETQTPSPMATPPLKILTKSPAKEEKSIDSTSANANSSSTSFVNPEPSSVTCHNQLTILASVYSHCLDVNLVPNIISEINFIVFLLTADYSLETVKANSKTVTEMCDEPLKQLTLEDGPIETNQLLRSVHNCVMFACLVIEKQSDLFQCFDKATIRLLLDNQRLSSFVPHFIPRLSQILNNKESNELIVLPLKRSLAASNGPVLYQTETDNKDNFSSDANFNLFKKQRDGFYAILHEWKLNNSDSSWVARKFPTKVQNMLGLCTDPINMMHLGRLFCGQLLNSKGEMGEGEDRLTMLEARFSRPQLQGPANPSVRPPLHFAGLHRFYQQFLQSASGSVFLTHVADNLLYRITVLDSTSFFVDGHSEEESVAEVRGCVSDLCLLAKFLGLVVFLPYKLSDDCSLTPDNLQTQIAVRHLMTPAVDCVGWLQRALASGRLVVTVPWVVAFLGMMDRVAPHLPSHHPALLWLASLLRALPLPHLPPHNSFLLRCSLGWLFDSSFFPSSVFFRLASSSHPLQVAGSGAGVDVRAEVGGALVAELWPGLTASLRQLLGKRGAKRHITPVPARPSPPTPLPALSLAQNAQLQLEEGFLNGQPASFRATVEFVVDRLSSSCIKHICSNTIASCKLQAAAVIRSKVDKNKRLDKEQTKAFVSEWSATTLSQIEAVLVEGCGGPGASRVLSELLGPDASHPRVNQLVTAICGRRCRHRVTTWLNSHINLTEIYTKLALGQAETTSSSDFLMSPVRESTAKIHKDSAMSPPDMLIQLQDTLADCIESRQVLLSGEQLSELIDNAINTVRFRSDLIPVANLNVYSVTVDLCIVILTYAPDMMVGNLMERFMGLWVTCGDAPDCLGQLLCARNVLLLCQAAGGSRRSWQALAALLVGLLRRQLLSPRQLDQQLVAMLRQDWPPMVFSLITTCLSTMLEQILKDPDCNKDPEFLLIIDCVTELTKELSKNDSSN